MRMVKNIFLVILVSWFSLFLFMPKQELYYKLEDLLSKNDIEINEKRIESNIFSLTLHGIDIYVKGIKLATAEEIRFFTVGFYTRVDMESVKVDETLKAMVPSEIETVDIVHSVLNPMVIDISSEGSFGAATGEVSIVDRLLHLDFNDTAGVKNLKSNLKENENGWYYETSF